MRRSRLIVIRRQRGFWFLWMGHLLVNRPDPLVKMATLTNRLICWTITPTCWPTGQSVDQAKILGQWVRTRLKTALNYKTGILDKVSIFTQSFQSCCQILPRPGLRIQRNFFSLFWEDSYSSKWSRNILLLKYSFHCSILPSVLSRTKSTCSSQNSLLWGGGDHQPTC